MARELSPVATLGAYVAGLALVFLGGLGVGRAVGPVSTAPQPHDAGTSSSTTGTSTHGDGSSHTSGAAR